MTVGEFVEWGKQGLEQAGVAGEIVIVDSSAWTAIDWLETLALAACPGASRGVIDAIVHRGYYVVMGDAD